VNEWVSQVADNTSPLFFILGPCSMESEEHTFKIASVVKELADKLSFKFIFKSSFDKANRISVDGFRSIGLEKGLAVLEKIRTHLDIPVITDVHESSQVLAVARVVDVIQIPAFLCRQTDLLRAAGKTGKPVFVKKGQFLDPASMQHVITKVTSVGNQSVWLGERGFAFGYHNLIVDYRNFGIMKSFGKPVIFDATHSVQRPGGQGSSSGGDRAFVPDLAASAIVQGIAGIFMEVHDNPEKALSDGPNSIRLSDLPELVRYFIALDAWAKQNRVPVVT
jgi:2-dehydro-3-deoxyphosphooctonate aldolase (KDO 8-P synthase)